jgi:L,D-transpeptidase ErfK/SrfK
MTRPIEAVTALVVAAVIGAPSAADRTSVITGQVYEHVTQRGESIARIAARVGMEPATLAADNGLTVEAVIEIGQRLHIDNRHIVPVVAAELVLNVPQRMLFHHRSDGGVVGYPVAVGSAGWQTPRGAFTVVNKRRDPAWHVPPSILQESRQRGRQLPPVVAPGPNNPLGARWIGLSLAGIGIHGTNAPSSIFRAVSHGCVRLHPDDVAALFDLVPIGATGESVYDPVLLAPVGDRILLEVHRDVYRVFSGRLAAVVRSRASTLGLSDRIDWAVADRVIAARPGVARDVTVGGAAAK